MNHIIDPRWFYSAIEQYSFDYVLYKVDKIEVDELGNQIRKYKKFAIRGSLQSKGYSRSRSTTGTSDRHTYEFYCKSLYRIDLDDIIQYRDKFMIVNSINDYDEWGVRSCELEVTDLSSNRELRDYVDYLQGKKLV